MIRNKRKPVMHSGYCRQSDARRARNCGEPKIHSSAGSTSQRDGHRRRRSEREIAFTGGCCPRPGAGTSRKRRRDLSYAIPGSFDRGLVWPPLRKSSALSRPLAEYPRMIGQASRDPPCEDEGELFALADRAPCLAVVLTRHRQYLLDAPFKLAVTGG
jgi:hypothetical protein